MTMNSSGPISLGGTTAGQSIEVELGGGGTAMISLNDTNVRTLAGVASGAIIMPTNFWGKSSVSAFFFAIAITPNNIPVGIDFDSSGNVIVNGNTANFTGQAFSVFQYSVSPSGSLNYQRYYKTTSTPASAINIPYTGAHVTAVDSSNNWYWVGQIYSLATGGLTKVDSSGSTVTNLFLNLSSYSLYGIIYEPINNYIYVIGYEYVNGGRIFIAPLPTSYTVGTSYSAFIIDGASSSTAYASSSVSMVSNIGGYSGNIAIALTNYV